MANPGSQQTAKKRIEEIEQKKKKKKKISSLQLIQIRRTVQ